MWAEKVLSLAEEAHRTGKPVRKWFYCADMSRNGDIIMKQKGVKRVCAEICEVCAKMKNCKIYKEEVIDAK